jgi:proline dehydrogenase
MLARATLLHLSKSHGLKSFLTRFKSFNSVTKRFVAGEHMSDAIEGIRDLNRKGMSASFDHLGESITSEPATRNEVNEYVRLLDAVKDEGLDSNISVKLTQLGLDVGHELCYENTRQIVQAAASHGNFVRIDMEDSSKTDATIAIFRKLRADFENVGIVIQAYLHRSESDVTDLLACGSRIRLCKGAYSEPASVAFPKKSDVDNNFVRLMRTLLTSGIYHGIATHDPKMIAATKQFASEKRIEAGEFEFQMLYGVRRDLQEQLVASGFRMRVYVPYGLYWYPYFMRRLAERPANVWFVLKNMMRG